MDGITRLRDVKAFISGASYPCSKEELVDFARLQGADSTTLSALDKLPMQTYEHASDVTGALRNF